MLTKRIEKKLGNNCTRMLRAVMNKSWKQHPTKRQLYGHLTPFSNTIQIRRTRYAGHYWGSKDELMSSVLTRTSKCWTTSKNLSTVLDDQQEFIYSSSVWTTDVAWNISTVLDDQQEFIYSSSVRTPDVALNLSTVLDDQQESIYNVGRPPRIYLQYWTTSKNSSTAVLCGHRM